MYLYGADSDLRSKCGHFADGKAELTEKLHPVVVLLDIGHQFWNGHLGYKGFFLSI